MNKNTLPDMTPVELQDRDGESLPVTLALFQLDGSQTVFIGDGAGVHHSVIARNTAVILEQLVSLFDLDVLNTTFMRHIVSPAGSTFGRFKLNWRASEVSSYTFKILHNLDEEVAVRHVISHGERIVVVLDEVSLAV